jgi:hypothetical protein
MEGLSGRLWLSRGESMPVRVIAQDGELVLLALMLEPWGALTERDTGELLLECTSPRGVIRLRGDLSLQSRDLVCMRVLRTPVVVQRRDFVRVRAPRPVAVSLAGGGRLIDTYAVDLSGGGMLLAGPHLLTAADRVQFRLSIEHASMPLEGWGTVVRVLSDGPRAVRFETVTPVDRERLVHFIFERERAARRAIRETDS